jgi:acetylornithine deacetylase
MNGLERRVVEEVARRREDLIDLTSTLIGFDTSVRPLDGPPGQEAALQEHLAGRLRRAGLAVDLWEPEPEELAGWPLPDGYHFRGRPQLLARRPGAGGGRSLVLNGHVDVVAAEPRERWASDPFRAEVRGGDLYGRGACDMKAGVAAMVLAAEVLADLDVPLAGDLLVNAVTDEESTGAGAMASVAHGVRADGGLVPEPTSLDLWLGTRGSLLLTATVEGRPGHAGVVQLHRVEGGAVNALEKMTRVVLPALLGLNEEWCGRPEQRHPFLRPGGVVPTVLIGGEWMVTYPARSTLTCHVTYLPAQADPGGGASRVQREVEDWVRRAAAADPWLAEHPPRVRWAEHVPPFEVPAGDPVVRAAQAAAGELGAGGAIATRTTWCDAATLTRAGIPAIALGPGSIDLAHTIDERVPLDELVRAAQLLALSAMRFCGVAEATARTGAAGAAGAAGVAPA